MMKRMRWKVYSIENHDWERSQHLLWYVCCPSVCLSLSLSHTHTHTYTHRGKGNDPCRAKFEMLTGNGRRKESVWMHLSLHILIQHAQRPSLGQARTLRPEWCLIIMLKVDSENWDTMKLIHPPAMYLSTQDNFCTAWVVSPPCAVMQIICVAKEENDIGSV